MAYQKAKSSEPYVAEPTIIREPAVSNETVINQTAVPADASLAAGQAVLYFDPTDGAGKLKIKGKTLNGTVVTGSVNLT